MKIKTIYILAVLFLINSCSPRDMNAHDAWTRPSMKGETAAVYLLIHNHTAKDDKLIGLSSNLAKAAEIHKSSSENDIMKMEMLASLPLASGDEYTFEPGGLHVMLVDINRDLKAGDRFDLTLHFENHEDITVVVEVTDQADADSGHSHP